MCRNIETYVQPRNMDEILEKKSLNKAFLND